MSVCIAAQKSIQKGTHPMLDRVIVGKGEDGGKRGSLEKIILGFFSTLLEVLKCAHVFLMGNLLQCYCILTEKIILLGKYDIPGLQLLFPKLSRLFQLQDYWTGFLQS
jgi:hypothetical protein